jgi:putative inorganic carbon (hco3(-)) transporter
VTRAVYLLTVLYLLCVYVRPSEIVPGWEGIPFAAILAAVSLIAMAADAIVRRRPFWNLPQDWFVLGFLLAVIVSNLSIGWIEGAWLGLLAVQPAVFCYFLIRSAATSATRLRWIGYTLVALTLFQAINGIAQYHTGAGLGEVAALDMHDDDENENAPPDGDEIRRIRGTGIFNDPNDLALAFVIVIPFLAGPLVRGTTPLWMRGVAAVCLVPLMLALFYTNSRGGMLGLGAALLPYAYQRFGRIAGPMVATIGIVALIALGPSRMNALDASETSAQNRVTSWWEGLEMFKSRPLFGIGFDRYTQFNDLVAHNSFVHTLAELGTFGAFFFIGMGYWFFLPPEHTPPPASALRALGDDLRQSGLGLTVCAMFLSRQYNVLPFITLALGSCHRHVLAEAMPTPAMPTPATAFASGRRLPLHLLRIGALTCGAIACTYVAVRVLSLWSE